MVPKGWRFCKLADISRVTSGGTPNRAISEYWQNGTIPWIRTTEVQNCILQPEDAKEYISELGLRKSSAKLIPENTILLAMIGQGKTRGQIALLKFEAAINQNCAAIIFGKSQEPEFYYHYLLSQYENIRNLSNSAGQSNLSGALVKAINVLVPPYNEQKKIAQILSTWDKAISVTEKLLTNSQQQKKALMQQLLTGQKRLLDENGVRFSGDWNSSKLGDLFNFKKGKGLSKSDLSESGINKCILYGELYTKYAEIAYEVISRTNSSDGQLSEPGDILLPASTTTSGIDLANATALSEGGILLGGDINILRPKVRLSSPFLAYFLTHMKKNEISSRAQGITIIHLYGGDLKSIDIVLPSTVQEQQKIATVLSAADAEISTLEKKLACLRDEKKALMQQLLTGKRRVKVDEAVAV
ncbi:restriction endonuclease subunit S [Escherichia coli]|uniref:restriction endonuclease subunit S n=1 Tax=Escherichia coli TaxID=562 RepID=UPI0038BC6CC6